MKVLIIEDEALAAKRMKNLLSEIDNSIEVLDEMDSVQSTVSWLMTNANPDLIFLDIQLADGLSFEIFELVDVDTPIIFTTAYDQYALDAFKVNSIDYLLKPLMKDDVEAALAKYRKRIGSTSLDNTQLEKLMQSFNHRYKNRFLIKIGEHIKSIPTSEIIYFFSRDKASYCMTAEGKSYLLDYSLEQLSPLVSPERYFRINRAFLVTMEAVKDIISYSNSRLKLVLDHQKDTDSEVIVSRERVQDFKKWLDQ